MLKFLLNQSKENLVVIIRVLLDLTVNTTSEKFKKNLIINIMRDEGMINDDVAI